ncbi:MAG: aldehyde dehydrogenase family protein [Planctomycetota bacterium]|jgi:succinate-semialdehyde dehydrogenase/glutarate-semialdehyde dehydrogenase
MRFGSRKLTIGGELRDAGERLPVCCPATDEAVAEVALADEELTLAALGVAGSAFELWATSPIAERRAWMLKLRDACRAKEELLREALMYETGKPWAQTEYEFGILMDALSFYAEEISRVRDEALPDVDGTHTHLLRREAAGPVVAMLAWNFPVLNLAYKLGPAMAAGCPIILKPSKETPLTAYIVGETCVEVGLPAGVVSVIAGPNDTVGTTLCPTGCRLMELGASSIKRYSMELGGNAPAIVFDDADVAVAVAVETVSALKFGNAGQICVAPNRVFVHGSVLDSFREGMLAKARSTSVGFGRDSDPGMGPLINARERERVHALGADAVEDGAEILVGGEIPDGRGSFYPPTVLAEVRNDMRIAREEIFGPVVAIIPFDSDDDVLVQANDTDAGLASYAFTRSAARIERVSSELRFGEVQVNGFKYAMDLPHLGIKQSGMGCDCSHLVLEDYMVRKRVTVAK